MATPSESLDDAALADLRHRFEPSVRTHWDDCYKDHAFCAVVRLCDELTAARQRIAELEDAATIYGAVMVQADGLEADLRARIAELEGERDALQRTVDGWAGIVAAHPIGKYGGTWRAFASAVCPVCGASVWRDQFTGLFWTEGALARHEHPTPAAREGE